MKEEVRRAIVDCSQQIDGLNRTKNLISTSNVICFTTMERGPEETVTIELLEGQNFHKEIVNEVIKNAKDKMIEYIDCKINELNEKIDKIIDLGV